MLLTFSPNFFFNVPKILVKKIKKRVNLLGVTKKTAIQIYLLTHSDNKKTNIKC